MTDTLPTVPNAAWGENVVAYDVETFPNCFLFTWAWLSNPEEFVTYEISFRRNDILLLLQFLRYCMANAIEMVGFNNVRFDYPIVHFIWQHGEIVTVEAIYAKAQAIINAFDALAHTVWQSDRIAPQIDLFMIHHFDNKAKTQSLKGLEFNMRSSSVREMPVAVGTLLTGEQIDTLLIPYNRHDVRETIRFARISSDNIAFRRKMQNQLDGDVLNFNDTKIGKQLFEQRLGDEVCYTWEGRKKVPRQTWRDKIVVNDILFPYIEFNHLEFRRVHDWLKQQTITETKGVFTDLSATINGFTFHFGTGGIHGSVNRKRYSSDQYFTIWDVDVAALYPSIGIVNKLYPFHLGAGFVDIWQGVITERGRYAKGTSENASLKLAANGVYGDSGNAYSPMYDPQFTMAITINGQLLLCKLAEMLMSIPTLEIIQINTDGITFVVAREFEWLVKTQLDAWQVWSRLKLEETRYARMFIRDVNNYLAESEPDAKGKRKIKRKGAYEFYSTWLDISNASPSAWHKDLGGPISQMAACWAMLNNADPEWFINAHTDPFDFMLRAKVDRRSRLFIGERETQRITRYYVAKRGAQLRKVSPPTGRAGTWKRKNGISEYDYQSVMQELRDAGKGDDWDARIHTANKSVYSEREIGFAAGWSVAECNDAADFDWLNLDRRYYVEEARKLVIT